MSEKPLLIVIAGPTASGKTDLAIRIAERYAAEIISADARQVYHEMRIGTARPGAAELARVPHHLVGHLSISDPYSAGQFGRDAIACLEDLFSRSSVAVMAGGSGLYINAVIRGLDEFPETDPDVRKLLQARLAEDGVSALYELLKEHDPDYARSVDRQNPMRLLRALEVSMSAGRPYSSFLTGNKRERPFDVLQIGIEVPRAELYERIDRRVDTMMAEGLLEEARGLHPRRGLKALETVGYRELFDHFEGLCDLDNAVGLIKRNTRRYAKRQLTWLNIQPDLSWYGTRQEEELAEYLERRCAPYLT